MSPDELMLRLRQVFAVCIASNEDMEAEGERVDWDLLDAANATVTANASPTQVSDGSLSPKDSHSSTFKEPQSHVDKISNVFRRAAKGLMRVSNRTKSRAHSSSGVSAETAAVRFKPAGRGARDPKCTFTSVDDGKGVARSRTKSFRSRASTDSYSCDDEVKSNFDKFNRY